jgi:LuxR family maltose regulon positive regulatory protein
MNCITARLTGLRGHQMPDQAIAHAMKINSLDLVARFIEQTLCDVLNREDVATLNRWLNLIPDEFIRQRPELLLVKAWDHSFRWELEKVLQSAEQAEALLDKFDYSDYTQILRGQIAMMKGQIFYHANQPERVIPYCRESLALLPKQWHYARGGAAVYLGLCLYATGQVDAAERFLSGEYESASDKINGYSLRLLLGMTINYLQAGKYENAARLARTMLQQAEDGKLAVIEGWGHYLLGFIHYEWNELELAARHFVQVVDLFYRLQWATARNGIIGLGQTYLALDQGANSLETIDRLSQIDITYRGQEQTDTTSARARLMLMEGNLEGAERWGQSMGGDGGKSIVPTMDGTTSFHPGPNPHCPA